MLNQSLGALWHLHSKELAEMDASWLWYGFFFSRGALVRAIWNCPEQREKEADWTGLSSEPRMKQVGVIHGII